MRIASILICCMMVAFVGCKSDQMLVKNANLTGSPVADVATVGAPASEIKNREIDLSIEPYQSLGILVTPNLAKGNVTTISGIFPDFIHYIEWGPGRTVWYGWAASEDGKEYFVQFVAAGGTPSRDDILATVIIDDKIDISEARGIKVLGLSSRLKYCFNLDGKVVQEVGKIFEVNTENFLRDPNYRKDLVMKYGSLMSDRMGAPYLDTVADVALVSIRSWHEYQTPKGRILSPLNEAMLKNVARINPQYKFMEKLIKKGKFLVTMDPIITAASLGIDIAVAHNAPSTGWDASSVVTRESMAIAEEYRRKMIRKGGWL